MATAVLTSTPTSIADGESTTGWSGDTFSLEPDIKVEGSNSVACAQTVNGNNDAIFTKATGSWDFSGGDHLRLSFNSSAAPTYADTLANGGIQVGLSDGTNTDWFYVSGSDVYSGGWDQIVLYTLTTPDVDNSANLAAITSVTWRMATTSKPRNVPANLWLDAWYYGDGYTVTGGTSGDPIDWSHIAALDKTSAYKIVEEINDVYFMAGEVTIGDGTATTYFEPASQIVQFKDLPVSSTLYQIIFFDDASLVANIDLVGGAWSAAGTQRFKIDASAVCNNFAMDGMQISRVSDGSSFHTGASVTNTVFNDCEQIVPNAATFTDNTISDTAATDGGLLWPSTSNISDCIFLNNTTGAGTEHATPASATYDGNTFTSNTYDVRNSGNASTITAGSFVVGEGYKILTVGTTDYTLIGAVDNNIGTKFVATGVGAGTGTATQVLAISKTNGSNPSTANNTGTNADTLFVGSVTVSFEAVDKDDTAISGVQVSAYLISDDSEVMLQDTIASGFATSSFSGATPADIYYRYRKASPGDTKYENLSGYATIAAGTGVAVKRSMTVDPNNNS